MDLRATAVALAFLVAGCAGAGTAASSGPSTAPPPPAGPCDGVQVTRSDGSTPDRSRETIDVTIGSGGAFVVEVPLPVSSDGTTFAEWSRNLTRGGDVATQSVDTPEGKALRLTGSGNVRVHACSVQDARGGNGCCAEAYLDARWTTTPDELRADRIRVHVASGSVDLNVTYHAGSSWCGRDASFLGALAAGWRSVPGDDSAWCE